MLEAEESALSSFGAKIFFFPELSDEYGSAAIELYPRYDWKPWNLDIDELQEKLRIAKLELDKNPTC